MKKNKDLNKFYDKVYKKGENKHYTKIIDSKKSLPIDELESLKATSWKGKRVLDVGCGTGLLCHEIAKKHAKEVIGLDFSAEAIKVAEKMHSHKNLSFVHQDIKDHKGKYDVIISLGTLEHMDDPFAMLKILKKHLNKNGMLIMSCPNWTNPRGYMLLTLWFLFKAPITLVDLHYLTPIEFEKWAKKLNMKLSWKTFDYDWAHGEKLLRDFERRIPNVLRDAKLPNKKRNVDEFIKWIKEHITTLDHKSKFSGALGLYIMKKR